MTRFSTSFAVEAATYVRPFMTVSTTAGLSSGPLGGNCDGRIIKVNVNTSSVSLSILRRKFGVPEFVATSGSWAPG